MTTEHEELVRNIYDAYARRDLAAALSRFSPEVEFVQTNLLPWGGSYRGLEGAQASLGQLIAHVDSRVEVEETFSAGDQVVVVGRTRGTARASGAPFDLRAVHVWTVVEGRITRFEAYIDTPAMLKALAPE
ncbi:MAG TPA: nuclear transport factor 2 family protein [Pyrinomonadaceae bacterium]|nr:nuclear transport factor 2 family protein [Pyrinomonadaceae bacterium]